MLFRSNTGRENKENNRMAEIMKYSKQDIDANTVAQEAPADAQPAPQA